MTILLLAMCFFAPVCAMLEYNNTIPNYQDSYNNNEFPSFREFQTKQGLYNEHTTTEIAQINKKISDSQKNISDINNITRQHQTELSNLTTELGGKITTLEGQIKKLQDAPKQSKKPKKFSQFMGNIYDHLSKDNFKKSETLLRRFLILATPVLVTILLYKIDLRNTNNDIKLLNLQLKHGKITELEHQSSYNKLMAFKFDDPTKCKIMYSGLFTGIYWAFIIEGRFW